MMKKLVIVLAIILAAIILLGGGFLVYLGKTHNESIHRRFVSFLNQELKGQVTFSDISLSFIRHFPNAHIRISDVSVRDSLTELIHVGTADMMLNLRKLLRDEIEIKKLIITDAILVSAVDSLGNSSRLLASKPAAAGASTSSFLVDLKQIDIRNSLLFFVNEIKMNRSFIRIGRSDLHVHLQDSLLLVSGNLTGHLDSLISNDKLLFRNLPAEAKDIELKINRNTGVKELTGGHLKSGSLTLEPRLRLQPHENGQLVQLSISGEDKFDEFLGLFSFHFGIDIKQSDPEARLKLTYNQAGFVNPFLRPYSELDFEISGAEFTGEDLPFPLAINIISGNYNNGEGHTPQTVQLVIDTINASVEESYIAGHFKLTNLRDPYINAKIEAHVDISHLFKANDNFSLSGLVDLELAVDGKISDLRRMHIEGKEQAAAEINIHEIKFHYPEQNYSVQISRGRSLLNNHILEISSLVGAFNKAAFHFNGHFENLDQFLLEKNEWLTGNFNLNIDKIDLTQLNLKNKDNRKMNGFLSFPFSQIEMKFLVNAKKIITQQGEIDNLTADCSITKNSLTIKSLDFNYLDGHIKTAGKLQQFDDIMDITLDQLEADIFDGHTSASGKIKIDSAGLKSIDLRASMDFKHLDPESIARKLALDSARGKEKSKPDLPGEINIELDFKSGKTTYHDLFLTGTSFKMIADNQSVYLKQLRTGSTIGNIDLDFTVRDYRSDQVSYSGDLKIIADSVSVDELLNNDLITALTSGSGKEEQSREGLPENINLQVDISVRALSYDQILINNLSLETDYSSGEMKLHHLDLDFASGKVHLDGNLKKDKKKTYAGYLYLKTDNIDLKKVLNSFKDFNQEAFTSSNSAGKISSASHHYFKLSKDLSFIRDHNFWLANVNIHNAQFARVEPIEKTLFFVGHKAKDTMIVSDLNINILLTKEMVYFRNLLMNDNIANLGLSGAIDVEEKELDFWAEISLTDLFFKSKKQRITETEGGIMTLDADEKIYLHMEGLLSDHKLSLVNNKKYSRGIEELQDEITGAQEDYRAQTSHLVHHPGFSFKMATK